MLSTNKLLIYKNFNTYNNYKYLVLLYYSWLKFVIHILHMWVCLCVCVVIDCQECALSY